MSNESERWLRPTPALSANGPGERVLTTEQERSWRDQGFALVDGVFPEDLVARARAEAGARFPAAASPESESITDFGSEDALAFPADVDAVNVLTLHPRILHAVAQLLAEEPGGLRLTQSDCWAKYGRKTRSGGDRDNTDQRIHADYPNHTLTHPPRWEAPEAVEILLYLDDVETCEGATGVVPRRGEDDPAYEWPMVNLPGVGSIAWQNDRTATEESLRSDFPEIARFRQDHLYAREAQARYQVGTVLFYRHDTWHRGRPLREGTRRLAQNMTFRKASSEWISVLQPGWAWAMYRPSQVMEKLIANASVEQRCVLGFPAPGNPYWTQETVDAVGARYGPLGIDMEPYQRALDSEV